jgi:hypothetical protein
MSKRPDARDHSAGAGSRRGFLKAAGAVALTAPLAPAVWASDKSGGKLPVVGEGAYRYEATHGWGTLPDHIRWGETHGVAIDESGLIYIKHRSLEAEPMDAIVVFDTEGKFVRSFGKEYHGGGHGIDVRKDNGEEFLYLSDIKHGIVAKTTLRGDQVWVKGRPPEPGMYDDPKAKYSPTNVAFSPDGGFYIADGYGSNYLHQYDRGGKWLRTWGGFGEGPGQFKTPHGLWLDDRPGHEPTLVVADRANARLQYFTLDGKHLRFVGNVSFPAHFDIRGDVLLCPDLHARVTLFDKDNQVITHLGYDAAWTKRVLDGFKMRSSPGEWEPGRFIHPHDACFDKDGNIFVVEWVPTGRVTKLRLLG